MAYAVAPLGLNDVETAQDLTELANKIYVETLYAFERSCVFMNLVYKNGEKLLISVIRL